MATTVDAVLSNQFINRYSENVLNKNLTFYKEFSANVVSGSGIANASSDFTFANGRSLFVNNYSTTEPLVINSGSDDWVSEVTSYRINSKSIFQFSIYNSSGIDITGRFRLFVNTSELYVLEFTVDPLSTFKTFYQNLNIPAGDFDLVFELDNDTEVATECYISGLKLEYDPNGIGLPSIYSGYVPKEYEKEVTLDFPSIASNDTEALTVELQGARELDFVEMSYSSAVGNSLALFQCYVSDNDEITVLAHNHTGGAINPSSGLFRFKIVK